MHNKVLILYNSGIPASIPNNAIITSYSYPESPSDNVTVNISLPVSAIDCGTVIQLEIISIKVWIQAH